MNLTKNFSLGEFDCNDGTPVPEELIDNVQRLANNLQVLRDEIGVSIFINSGYRTKDYNKKVSGAKNSQHLTGKAADIHCMTKWSPKKLYDKILELIEEGKMEEGGLSLYQNFVHYDIRGKKSRW